MKQQPPKMFRPLLWSFRWEDIDVQEDKEDIILNAINEGSLDHWRFLIRTYGKPKIREVLSRHPASAFHPESRNLARVIFSIPSFSNARRSTH